MNPHPSVANGSVRNGYAAPPGQYDEMTDGAGGLRPPWQSFFSAVDELGMPELSRRWEEAQHLIRENGVTYNVYGDPRGVHRPWQLDPVPLLISSADAQLVEAGLDQRARLLELVLADLYGPQKLLHEGLLPPELIFASPSFLRPLHGVRLCGGRRLHLVAADLGRGPDGGIRVLSHRTQAPSGAGYALENRIVLSRMLPDVFRDCRVQRLALFFRTLRDTLRSIAPFNRDNPRVVLLTPGPYNEVYFEHAYLANYLGMTLVEGGDLTVRDSRVYLKLLGGLQPVDVIFRRLDDDYCDPLELRGDSFLGVPGLVQAVRAGRVAVANALGSGLAESPALLGFLPTLCRHVLGEGLRLPSVPTWWCGEPVAMEHVIAHLPDMVIKPAFPTVRRVNIFGDTLGREQRHALAERIRARPRDFVGQEVLSLSTAPVLANGRLEPRPVVVRAYLAAAEENAFTLMPGGLTRFSASADTLVVSMQHGGGSKDTWVLSSAEVSDFSLLRPTVTAVELSRGGSDLPSRAADNLYWLGRYAERAEGVTRMLRGVLVRLTEKSGLADVPELPALLRTLTHLCEAHPGFVGEGAAARLAAPEEEVLALVFDTHRPGSLAATLQALGRIAGVVRDRMSGDMWRILSRIEERGTPDRDPRAEILERGGLSEVLNLLNRQVLALAAFGGLAMESMTRAQGWRFLDIGRRLERCLALICLLRHTLGTAQGSEGPLLEAVLEIADSSMTYRRRYLGSLQTAAVLDLLLADETNPRSLAFQLAALADDVDNLPQTAPRPGRSAEQRLVLASLTAVRLADVEVLARPDGRGVRPQLEEMLKRLATDLPGLSECITRSYLAHLQASRHLAGSPIVETR